MRFFLLFTAIILASCSTQSAVDRTNPSARIDSYLQAGVENGFSGAVLIAKDDEIILNKGYGLANKGEATPNTPDTVFDIGSVTKQFTAAAILVLSDQDKLRVDEQISRFFPELPADKKNITIHQLLTHTAGLVDSFGDGDFDHISQNEFFEKLFTTSLLFEPGEKHEYSNAGYSILARIIELTSGQEYEVFLSEYLFRPAGMHRTGYLLPDWQGFSLAEGYIRNVMERGTMVGRYQSDGKVSWNLKGNGGINSTQHDMYLWHQALDNNTVLSKELTTKLTTPYVPELEGGSSYYAYGWAIYTSDRNTKIVSHNGGNGAFFHDYLWLPEDDAVIIFSTNAASRQVDLAWSIEEMLFDQSYDPEPIIKNVYQFVLDFVPEISASESAKLESILRSQYSTEIGSPEALNRMGYMIMRSGQNLEWAVEIFKLNAKLFENEGNVWDSLGDAYRGTRQNAEAIQAYENAVRFGAEGSKEKIAEIDR